MHKATMRIALATLRFRPNPDNALRAIVDAMREAAAQNARIVCTAECYLPGLRGVGLDVAAPDADFLARAERTIRETAAATGVAAVVGVERVTTAGLIASAMIVARDGQLLGFQDKVQIDPSEEGTYTPGHGRKIFEIDGLRFGVAICHEGWRYPETVRWAASRGAQIVFHPQFSPEGDSPRTTTEWASTTGTMHEKAAVCRAAENTIYFATVNYAIPNSIAGTALIDPDGAVTALLTDGTENLLIADIDPLRATGLLARRLAASEYP
jgi:predicted amidohydrolase